MIERNVFLFVLIRVDELERMGTYWMACVLGQQATRIPTINETFCTINFRRQSVARIRCRNLSVASPSPTPQLELNEHFVNGNWSKADD